MRKKYLILFLFIAVSLFSQQYPSVNQNHPRLYVSQQRFNFLDSSRTVPPVSTYYNQFTSNYFGWWYNTFNFYLVGSDSTQWTYLFRYFNSNESAYRDDVLYTGLFTAFIYKINHDPVQLKRTRFVINRYISAVDTMNYAGYTGDNLETMLRYFGMLGSALHDWCYYDIDSLTRSRLGSAVYKLNRKFMNSFIYTSGGNSYVSSHNAWNCVLTLQNVLSVYGSDGINPLQHDTVVTWYQNLCDKWTNGFFPVYGYYRSTSGGWNWGAAYSLWSLTDQFTLFENFYNGTDKNYYADLPWVLNSINQYYYFMRPDGICIHLGDGETRIIGDNVIYRHSKIFSDQRSRFLAQKYSVHPLPSTYAYYNILCYKDFSAPVVSHPQLPLNWLSDRAGLLVSRTSWDSNAVMYWLFNSHSKKAAHEHGDNNTFTVYYKKPLLLDAGFYESYGSPHYTNYYMRTAAHNTVTVFDSTEQFYYSGNLVSNDGGHLISSPMMNYNDIFAPAFQRGRWIAYAHDSTFVYSNTDASLSFNPQKVKRHLRKVIFRKPDKFVILDNVILAVNLSGAVREIRWNAHFRNMPQVTGQLVNSQVPGHIEMFSGKKITAVNNPAYITFSTVFPDSTLIRRIGGTGYEFWINGQNYPPSGNPDTNLYNPGRWRTEVVPYVNSDTVNFLHTGFVADVGIPEPPSAVKIASQTTLGCDYSNTIYLFSMNGDTGAVSHYASGIAGGRTVGLFAFDLKRNFVYNIFLNGILVNTVNSDSSGLIIGTYSLPADTNTIHITTGSTGSSINGSVLPEKYALEQNFPNPFNPNTIIGYQLPVSNYTTLIIYDIAGRVIQTLVEKYQQAGKYQVQWDGSKHSSGVYLYRLTSGTFTDVKKMVILK